MASASASRALLRAVCRARSRSEARSPIEDRDSNPMQITISNTNSTKVATRANPRDLPVRLSGMRTLITAARGWAFPGTG